MKSEVIQETVPGPGMLTAFRGLGKHGFLDYIGEAWKVHGDVFRLNLGIRSLLFVMHPDAVQQVSVGNSKNYGKLKSYDVVRKYLTGEGLIASTGDLWRSQRKLLAPFFTPKGVQAYAGIMIRDTVELTQRWEKFADSREVVEISEEMMRVTASIILKSIFSSEIDDETLEMKDCIEVMIRFATLKEQGIPYPDWLPIKRNREYIKAREKVFTYIRRIILQRREMPVEQWPEDLLSQMMLARDEETGEPLSESLLRDEALTAFIAGHETTARTMSATWVALCNNPEAAAKLHEELDRELGGRTPTVEDLFRLPYTLQVVKEVLRLYPAAPFYVRDAIAEDEIMGFKVEPGTAVMLSPYFTHRHPDFWENPDKFDPDRWTPEKEKAQHRYAYHPFAAGQRICIGNNFALLESHLLLAILASKYELHFEPGFNVTWEMQGTLGTKEGFPMIIRRRK